MEVSRWHALRILDWCISSYGASKYNGPYPHIEFRREDVTTEKLAGYYCDIENVIFLNKDFHLSIKELAKTIIHEYTHYRQNMKHYHVLSEYLSYKNNPLEKQATKTSTRDYKKCLSELKKIYPDKF